MKRVGRLDLVLAWLAGYVTMGLLRMALGQGGLIFALGPMTGAEFALFTFSMIPEPKTNPPRPDPANLTGGQAYARATALPGVRRGRATVASQQSTRRVQPPFGRAPRSRGL